MKKKLLGVIAAGVIAAQLPVISAYAVSDNFTVVKIPCAEGEDYFNEDYQKFDSLSVRYADDKTPIPLNTYYDGYMFATIPKKSEDRKVEWYLAEEKSFTDESAYADDNGGDLSYDFYVMKKLSKLGVITGDDYGRALPKKNVTRAEATAMIMRMLGLDSTGDKKSGFADVSADAWYAGVVTAARNAGLISGDSETEFNPLRNVSREEATSMAARALLYTGYATETKDAKQDLADTMNIRDIDDISDWALSAYDILKYQGCFDYEYIDNGENEEPEDYQMARPKQAATRSEICQIIESSIMSFQIYPSQIASEYGFDKEMPVIDGSTSTYPFTEAIYSNLFYNGYTHPDKPKKHSKSHASYQRLINGEVDAIVASVYPAEDIIQMAKDKGVELEMIPIAYDAMIFFTNPDNDIKGLTQQQISDIYVDNKYSNWKELGGPDALLYPYCRNNDSGSHAQMQRHFLNGKEINEQIRQESTSIEMASILTDVMGAKTDDPKGYALGYSIFYYFNTMKDFIGGDDYPKLLSIDGVYPTDETIADGTYPLSNNTYVVIRADEPEDSKARKFADFMLTDLGQQCVADAGFGPLKPQNN